MNAPEGRVGDVGCSSRMNRLNECNKIKDRMTMYAGCGAGVLYAVVSRVA